MKNLTNLSPSDVKEYIAELRDKDNRNKLITVIVVGSVIISLLVAGIVYLIKSRYCECGYDDWDDEWDEEKCNCDSSDCCCNDSDVDSSVKVKTFDE